MKSSYCQNTATASDGALIKLIGLHFKTSVGFSPSDDEMARNLDQKNCLLLKVSIPQGFQAI